ncbi:MAG: hypothetical protein M1839_004575 [Geoglossum umbratile]|nr:MAG: hypothetical protein M1839_004575 [Geoglossum umbratile]
MANVVFAANCFDVPRGTFDSNSYTDIWNAQASLCKLGSAGVTCGDAFGDTITCRMNVGNAYAVMEGVPGEGYQDMYNNCLDAFRSINECVYSGNSGGNYHINKNSYWLHLITMGATP